MRRGIIDRRKALKRKKKLAKMSQKQRERLEGYWPVRAKFLAENPWCVICAMLRGKRTPATEIHHLRGRRKSLLCDPRGFVPTCKGCRLVSHDNPKWARAVGVLAEKEDWGKTFEQEDEKGV